MSSLKLTFEEFKTRHIDHYARFKKFIVTKRGRKAIGDDVRINLTLAKASSLKAINLIARLRFTEIFTRELRALFGEMHVSEVFFVTLVMCEHAVSLDQAASFDIKTCKNAMQKLLGKSSFCGMVEAAYYYRSPFVAGDHQPYVSWHTHALVWGIPKSHLAENKRLFNEAHGAFVPGCDAVHYRRVSAETALSYAFYICKATLKEYTAYPRKREVIDSSTGEIITQVTGQWSRKKRPIRPSNHLRAISAIGERTLGQLFFAGGAGDAVRRRVLKGTKASLCAEAYMRKLRRRELLFVG